MGIKLTKRLNAIAACLQPCKCVVDVGTDHGYIPIFVAENRLADKIIATDIGAGPLENAKRSAKVYGVYHKIEFVQTDGLAGISPDEVETVILAGMGGETIVAILKNAYWLKKRRVTLVLQPQSKVGELSIWLKNEGYAVCDASLVEDAGKLYIIFTVKAGEGRAMVSSAELFVNRILLEKRDPLLPKYLDELILKAERVRNGMGKARKEISTEEAMHLRVVLSGLKKMREETSKW